MTQFSPERLLINKDSSQREIQNIRDKKESEIKQHKENLDVAYEKASGMLDDERIKSSKFKGLYGKEIIKNDDNYVEERQRNFRKNDTPEQIEMQKYATVFEAIIHDQIDMNGWLGEHAKAKKASWYDDFKNGIDEIVEFEQTETSATSHLALGVDITFSTGIFKKMNDIKTRIDSGDIGVIKYLLTKTYRGEMRDVPRVVIGADMKNLNEIIKLWVDKKKKNLAQHRVKFMVLSQIMMQLNDFAEYAEKIGKHEIADSFFRVLKIVENVWEEESKKYPDGDLNFDEDRVYSAIKNYCDDLDKQ
jgi:hypothetical protein